MQNAQRIRFKGFYKFVVRKKDAWIIKVTIFLNL